MATKNLLWALHFAVATAFMAAPLSTTAAASQDSADSDLSPHNRPPAVRIIWPRDRSTFHAPTDVAIAAEAVDFDGEVVSVEFFAGDRSLGIVKRPIHTDDTEDKVRTHDENLIWEWRTEEEAAHGSLNRFGIKWVNVPPGQHRLSAVATDNLGAHTRSEPITIQVTETSAQPVVTVKASDPIATEPGSTHDEVDTAAFTISRTGAADFPMTVYYRLSGTASNGVDYARLPGEVLMPAGSRSVDVVIVPLADDLVEHPESVILTLVEPVCIAIYPPPRECYLLGRERQARAVIYDRDSPNHPPRVRIVRPENGSLFHEHTDIRIVAEAYDPDGKVAQVEFFEGRNSLGVATEPAAFSDRETETFSLVWASVPHGSYVLTAVATDDQGISSPSQPVEIKVLGTVLQPVVNIFATDRHATEPNPFTDGPIDTATFTVTRSCCADEDLTVFYHIGGTASNGIDYERLPDQVTIPAGARSAEIVVVPLPDDLPEGTETVTLRLEPPICPRIYPPPPECYLIGRAAVATVYIHDLDVVVPSVAIVRPEHGQVFPARTDIEIVVEASDPDGWITQVDFFAGSTRIGSEQLHFIQPPPPGETYTFSFTWTSVPAGRHLLGARATSNSGKITASHRVGIAVEDASRPPVVTIVARDAFAQEGTDDTAQFEIRRTHGTNEALTVYYTIGGTALNGVDYAAIREAVIIPAGRYAATVLIEPIADDLEEGIETVVLRLRHAPEGAAPYVVGHPGSATAIIADADMERPKTIRLHDDSFHLRLAATSGLVYRIEASTDLKNWEPLFTNMATDEAIHFVDDEAAQHPVRFYRIVPEIDGVHPELSELGGAPPPD
jgi:hypothetical protein